MFSSAEALCVHPAWWLQSGVGFGMIPDGPVGARSGPGTADHTDAVQGSMERKLRIPLHPSRLLQTQPQPPLSFQLCKSHRGLADFPGQSPTGNEVSCTGTSVGLG